MNIVTSAALLKRDEQKEFEDSLLKMARAEMQKRAGEFSEAVESLANTSKSPRLDRLSSQTKVAAQMGRELAKEAGIGTQIMGAVKPLANKAMGYAAAHPRQALMAGGAAVGAAGGAATAQPGQGMSGALTGAALGGAAGYGASKLPGGYGRNLMQGVSRMGAGAANKVAPVGAQLGLKLAGFGMKAGVGALVGGTLGALHTSNAAQQGLVPAHHLGNALLGAAGGALAGGAASKLAPAAGAAVHAAAPAAAHIAEAAATPAAAVAHAAPAVTHMPTGNTSMQSMMSGWGQHYTPQDVQQMGRIRDMANSPAARGIRPAAPAAATAMGSRKPVGPAFAQTMPKMAGREFIKRAFSMSAQAEPGDPTGAQDPETDSQFLSRPQSPPRPPSKPAMDLYNALKHLSPKMMRGLQAAQPGQ